VGQGVNFGKRAIGAEERERDSGHEGEGDGVVKKVRVSESAIEWGENESARVRRSM